MQQSFNAYIENSIREHWDKKAIKSQYVDETRRIGQSLFSPHWHTVQ